MQIIYQNLLFMNLLQYRFSFFLYNNITNDHFNTFYLSKIIIHVRMFKILRYFKSRRVSTKSCKTFQCIESISVDYQVLVKGPDLNTYESARSNGRKFYFIVYINLANTLH